MTCTSDNRSIMGDTRSILWRCIFNTVVVIITAIPILFFYFFGNPTVRGFFCSDESLRHPFLPSTVPAPPLYVVGFLLPLITIVMVESLGKRKIRQEGSVVLGRFSVPSHAVNVYLTFIGYLFGTAVTQCLTDVIKYSVGRLRPHFFAVCNPDFDRIQCGTETDPLYVTNYVCRGNSNLFGDDPDQVAFRVREARISFVSGHSSFSFQIAVFLVMYLQARGAACLGRKNRILIIPFLQFFFVTSALFTAISRVMDYKHHAGDVIAGGLLGTFVQVLNTVFVMGLFHRKSEYKVQTGIDVITKHTASVEEGIQSSTISQQINGNSRNSSNNSEFYFSDNNRHANSTNTQRPFTDLPPNSSNSSL